jgi:hypothetical protein
MRSGNSERSVSTEEPPLMTFTLGVCELAAWAGADNDEQTVLTVHQEAEMGEEVGSDEGFCDVGHHEPPCELPA